jgi:hypothetical protein
LISRLVRDFGKRNYRPLCSIRRRQQLALTMENMENVGSGVSLLESGAAYRNRTDT